MPRLYVTVNNPSALIPKVDAALVELKRMYTYWSTPLEAGEYPSTKIPTIGFILELTRALTEIRECLTDPDVSTITLPYRHFKFIKNPL